MAGDTALCCDLGLVPYAAAHRLQLDLVGRIGEPNSLLSKLED